MDVRPITDFYAVAPQIEPSDMAALAAAGFVAVVNNRPDAEVDTGYQSAAMQAAAEAAGLAYLANPVENGGMTLNMVAAQGAAVAAANGPVLAWCRSGTRSSIVWALSQAGQMPTAEILALLAKAGYEMPGLGAQIDALAAQQ